MKSKIEVRRSSDGVLIRTRELNYTSAYDGHIVMRASVGSKRRYDIRVIVTVDDLIDHLPTLMQARERRLEYRINNLESELLALQNR